MALPVLPLTPDELLSTTRAVRKRLDLTRPVERTVLEECLALAQQAPSGSNQQDWRAVVVTDAARRQALAELYRRGAQAYRDNPSSARHRSFDNSERQAAQARVWASADFLEAHMHEVPAMLIPCIPGRMDGRSAAVQAARWGSVLPAVWSFMLAARARGLGTCWTTFHLQFEQAAAEILDIPYAEFTQAALIPVAYTRGTHFRPATREPLDAVVRWNSWSPKET
jgi:nitroreductase